MKGALGVIGYEAAQERFAAYLRSGRIHPALVIVGPSDEARWNIAKSFSRSLLCTSKPPNSVFCGRCSSCRKVTAESFSDLTLLRGEEEPIKIEWIRSICYDFQLAPLESHSKVCIIENADRLNAASSNALLKTLEEPPPGRYFLLLTSKPSALLPTIASRCLFFSMGHESGGTETAQAFSFDTVEQAVDELDSREKCVSFVSQLQKQWREKALSLIKDGASRGDILEVVDHFEASCTLQSRLRSQANYGLLLETFLREHNPTLGNP